MRFPVTPSIVRAIQAELDARTKSRTSTQRRDPKLRPRSSPLRRASNVTTDMARLAKRVWLWLVRGMARSSP